MDQIIECVPNFSEGRDPQIIQAITNAIASVDSIKLLHTDMGSDANRTVVTFVGSPEGVLNAAYLGIKRAAELIDMRQQKGAHPRIGATDVCPLVPIKNISLNEVSQIAHQLGKKVGKTLKIPVYMYESSATTEDRSNLARIRSGEYEGMDTKIKREDWKPDYGPTQFNLKSGATVIGARNFLIAFNVNLDSKDVQVAKKIASKIRTSGFVTKGEWGNSTRVPGICKSLKAIGWYMDAYNCAQVSMNLTNFHETSLFEAFTICREIAEKEFNVKVTGSELIGMVPLQAICQTGQLFSKHELLNEAQAIELAIKKLNLTQYTSFDPEQRIIEYKFQR